MNLKSKNGEDVFTLDATERRCLVNAANICARVGRMMTGTDLGIHGEDGAKAMTTILRTVPETQPRKKEEAGTKG